MSDVPWREQVTYYRRRAAEYDATSYGDLTRANTRIAAVVDQLRPAGDVLEIACGTGLWTQHLTARARTVTALDAAPEMIALARRRLPGGNVTFRVTDVLDWVPRRRFDCVFFAFWLSHVPQSAFGRFWSVVRDALADGGRALFVDDQPAATGRETYVAGSSEVVERCLEDGSRHRLVKVVRDPADLTGQLTHLGWQAAIWQSGPDWLLGQAQPAW
jgi:demethylmenaquinone methyltransferase/2-methoxy-6-polyprenyl-1,4-benzoquinol methylase